MSLLGGGPAVVALAASPKSSPVSSAAVSAAVSSAQASAAAAQASGAGGAGSGGAGSGGASALGGGSTGPLSPGLPQSNATTSTATSASPLIQTSTTAGDSGLSGGTAVAIGIGALAVLAAISFFIWHDARRRAPVRARAAAADGDPRGGAKKRPVKPRKLSPAERRRRKRGRAR
ncbi:MAG TPA: hypothetical protein VLP43_09485 [Solirubrobacteraceae bacterium]|nr:hypothetical protein [Solirubrobacteraceae bacterium]